MLRARRFAPMYDVSPSRIVLEKEVMRGVWPH